jgi:hypothetical protein
MSMSPDDDNKVTFWVATDPRRVVKAVTTGPQLNGGRLTMELQEYAPMVARRAQGRKRAKTASRS